MRLLALLAYFAAVFVTPARSADRFLFIVDTSSSMKPLDNVVRETTFDFIYSGLHGHMTNGDTYGIWLVNNENDTSFAMETWRPKYNVELGARASVHVKEHGFKGKARLDVAIAEAVRILKRVHDLTIVLLSNGETPIAGTPFDEEINARYRELAPVMKKAKLTLNTVLVAQDGAIVAWTVNTPESLIEVPYVAPKPPKPEIAAAKTNTVLAPSNLLDSAATTPVEPPKPRIASNPIIITKETVAQEKRSYQAMTTTGTTNEPPPLATNSTVAQVPTAETNAVPLPMTNIVESRPAVAATNPPVLQSNAIVTAAATNRAETNAVAATTKIESTNVALVAKTASTLPLKVSAPQPARASISIHPALWVAMGAGAASLGVLTTVLIFRSRRREPSLISQAMVRQRIGSIIS
jgi:hypothetical protein